jgi:hypothetical protein
MEFDQSFNVLFIKKASGGGSSPTPPTTPPTTPTSPSANTPAPAPSNPGDDLNKVLQNAGLKVTKTDSDLDKFINAFISVATQKGQSGEQARAFILQKKTDIEQLTALIGPDDAIRYWKEFIDKNSLTPQDTFKIFESAISCSYSSGTNTRDILEFGLAFTVANRDPETLKFIMDETCTLASINPNIQPFKIMLRAIKGEKFDARDSTFFKYDNPLHSAMLNRLMSLSVLTKQTDDVLSSDEAARLIDISEKAKTFAAVERDLNNYLFRGDYAKIEADNINKMRGAFKNSLSDPLAQAFRRMFFIFDMGQNLQQQILQNIGLSSQPETKRNFGPTFQKKSNNEYNIRLSAEEVSQPKAAAGSVNSSETEKPTFSLESLKKYLTPLIDPFKEIITLLKPFENDSVLGAMIKPLLSVLGLALNADALFKAIESGSIFDLAKNLSSVVSGVDTSQIQANVAQIINQKKSNFNGKFIKVETNNNKYFNISLDSEQKQILNKDNLNDDIFNNLFKIHTMKQEIKTINEEIKELINK